MIIRDPERFRAAKEARRLSYRQLAAITGVTPGFLSSLSPPPGTRPRKRSCTPAVAARIERALDVEPGALFEHRLASDPSTGELPIQPVTREDPTPAPAPIRMPSVSTESARGRHRKDKV